MNVSAKEIMQGKNNIPIQTEVFSRLGRDLAATTSAEAAAQIILDAADQLIGWEACYLILYDPEKGASPRPLLAIDTVRGRRVVQRDVSPATPSKNMLRAIDEGGFISLYAEFFELEASQSFGDRTQRTLSQIFVPVVSGTRVIGVLSIQSYRRNAYRDEHLNLVKLLAGHCAGALERIWAQEALGELLDRLKVLQQAANEINASLNMERVCHVIYETVKRVMPCNDFVMDGYDETTNEIAPIYAVEHPGRRIFAGRYFADHGLAGEVVRTKKSFFLNSPESIAASGIKFELFGATSGDIADDPTNSILAAPLILHGKSYGMISAQSYQSNAYTQDDLYLLEVLASHAAIALENARLFESIQTMARTDPLTKVLNRRRFFELAEAEFAKAQEGVVPFSVIMLDVDDFKQFNDRFGHKVGDAVLILTAETCKESLRVDDIFGRLGGEEFVVALPNTRLNDAFDVADRLRAAIQQTNLGKFTDMQNPPSVTVSVGVTEFEAAVKSLDVLLDRADKAMYAAKNGGRNQVRVWGRGWEEGGRMKDEG